MKKILNFVVVLLVSAMLGSCIKVELEPEKKKKSPFDDIFEKAENPKKLEVNKEVKQVIKK